MFRIRYFNCNEMCTSWVVYRLCGYPPFYSMKGLALSPGMRNRIAKGYYAFPPEEWDPVSQSSKRSTPHISTYRSSLLLTSVAHRRVACAAPRHTLHCL
ncbi:hypothetical protein Y032_0010g1090 [Ancylostoma ceylanicum]|uniref:Uncharacterized protein n=1 Tax=Ancylostoma ceylanicum TaxID=53326 RepID=A0A016VH10_9BILA|nr:hypothetical protein Y032_0010g1090 [Ancylostoma ceylanicum]